MSDETVATASEDEETGHGAEVVDVAKLAAEEELAKLEAEEAAACADAGADPDAPEGKLGVRVMVNVDWTDGVDRDPRGLSSRGKLELLEHIIRLSLDKLAVPLEDALTATLRMSVKTWTAEATTAAINAAIGDHEALAKKAVDEASKVAMPTPGQIAKAVASRTSKQST